MPDPVEPPPPKHKGYVAYGNRVNIFKKTLNDKKEAPDDAKHWKDMSPNQQEIDEEEDVRLKAKLQRDYDRYNKYRDVSTLLKRSSMYFPT